MEGRINVHDLIGTACPISQQCQQKVGNVRDTLRKLIYSRLIITLRNLMVPELY
jgi:hypothetical protein